MKRAIPLGKIATIQRHFATYEECETLPYVGLEHIEKDKGGFTEDFARKSEKVLAQKYRFTSEHVLYGKLRPYLNKVALPTFDGVCTTEILPILPNPECLDRTYLWGYLITPQFVAWASNRITGANLPRLSPELLESHEIPLPPLEEQKRIAARLSKADRLRRLRRTALEMSAGYLQSVFLEMFGDPATNPMGWDVVELGTICHQITDGVHKTPKYTSDGVPFISTVNIGSDNRINWDSAKYISHDEHHDLIKRCYPRKGDVLYTKVGSVGTAVPIVDEVEFSIFVQLALIKVDQLKADPFFITQMLNMPSVRDSVQSKLVGATMKYIGIGDISRIKVIVPPTLAQIEFSTQYKAYERLRAQQREALRQAEHLFQTLLHESFG